jgi:hypothetical protein
MPPFFLGRTMHCGRHQGSNAMTAFNVGRFRVKPGREQEFLDAHRNVQADWPGLKKVNMIKSGERSYCIIGEWADMTDLAAARPKMIATLDTFRDTLEVSAAALVSLTLCPVKLFWS